MNNQSAFPLVEPVNSGDTVHTGMSLRDYFAGQVLAGGGFKSDSYEGVAEFAYAIADAMLEARNVP